jgi:hypothetical protein
MNGKTIRIYLADGSPTGVRTAELSSWTGKAVVCQRSQLADLAKRPEAKRTGVYLLVGPDPESASRERVYIGEGDSVLDRLVAHDHDASKDFWTQAALFISKDENLTKAHVRYLERALILLAQNAGRCALANSAYPDTRLLPESDIADMEYFLEQVQLLLPVLGFTFLQTTPASEQLLAPAEGAGISPFFYMNPVGAQATAREYKGSFIVLKGSTARKDGVASWDSYRELRDRLVSEGKLSAGPDDRNYTFLDDVEFSSPSAAATVVNAGNQNGQIVWKVKDTEQTYREWKENQLKLAEGLATSE